MSFNDHNMESSSKFPEDHDKSSIITENKDNKDANVGGEENRDNHTRLAEEVYQDQLANIRKELRRLRNGKHADYVKELKKLKQVQKDQLMINNLLKDRSIEAVEREYIKECRLARKEFDDRSSELTKTLIAELNERKKTIELERLTAELSPDSDDQKPLLTRKLRRRPNDPVVPVTQERRRNLPSVSNINYELHEDEIEQDIKVIQESLASIPSTSTSATPAVRTRGTVNSSSIRKPGYLQNSVLSSGHMSPEKSHDSDSEGSSTISDTRIEDGKLLFEKIWYHRGQPIFVEGRQLAKFPAVIHTIFNETIWVKKTLDNSKFRIKLAYLSKGQMSIKRRAAV